MPKAQAHTRPSAYWWFIYACQSCGGVVAAATPFTSTAQTHPGVRFVEWLVPEARAFDQAIPERVRNNLDQARETISSPGASVLMSAAAVDAMLKHLNYKTGSLYSRIDKAVEDHLITKDMSEWAHDVRLDANDERHADDNAQPAATADAERCLEFASTLADIFFVLPARVRRGRKLDPAKP